jgi:nicotinamidase-related amidase
MASPNSPNNNSINSPYSPPGGSSPPSPPDVSSPPGSSPPDSPPSGQPSPPSPGGPSPDIQQQQGPPQGFPANSPPPSPQEQSVNTSQPSGMNAGPSNDFGNEGGNQGGNEAGYEEEGEEEYYQSNAIHRIPELELGGRGRKTALIVVNVQNCFFRGGGMAMFPSGKLKEDVENEKNLIRKINNLISLHEEDQDYFNAGLGGSPVMTGSVEVKTDPSTGMKLLDGSYPTGSRKKYFFDHIIYTQTAYPPDHFSFASHHYLREKKQKLKDMMEMDSIGVKDAMEKLTDDQLDKYYWSFVNTNFENKGMSQFNPETNTKLWADHALTDGSDVIIENQRCYRGIDFHPRLNLGPLYCPNQNLNPQVYITKPIFDGRGKVLWLGANDQSTPRSAFINNNNESTGLVEYLTSKNVEELYIVGVFRDTMVELTAVDAVANGFQSVNIIYDATLPFNVPTNNTKVNNKFYFKNIGEINKFLELTGDGDESDYYDYLRENNIWAQNIEAKSVNLLNYQNIIENITVAKEEFSCGIKEDDLIKTFDVFLKTSTATSRGNGIIE